MKILYEIRTFNNMPSIRLYKVNAHVSARSFRNMGEQQRTQRAIHIMDVTVKKSRTRNGVIDELRALLGDAVPMESIRGN